MNVTIENILLIGSILLILSIIAGKTTYRFGVPVILLFVVTGMLAGSEGIGGINFNDPAIARFIGFVALNFILFSGGLDTRLEVIRPVLWQGLTLSTLGVFITALTLGTFVWAVTDFTIYEGLLLGSIVSSTDAAAVFSILRSRNIHIRKNLRATLEFESGSNDPMAFFLTIALTGLITNQEQSGWSILPFFLKQMIIGGTLGFGFGILGKELLNRIKLDFEGLYPVLVIALMFLTSSFTEFVGGNSFLAIYIAAIYLGNQNIIHKKTIMQVFDGIAWLMQIILFLTLGLLVFPSNIIPVVWIGLLISGFLIFVARPISAMITLIPFRIKLREKAFIAWVGLRGAVPIVFATYPLLAGVGQSEMIFNIVFFISLSSVIIQGTTIPFMTKLLNVVVGSEEEEYEKVFSDDNTTVRTMLKELALKPGCPVIGKKIVDVGFPSSVRIAIIKRNDRYILPEGSTIIEPDDRFIVLAENQEGLDKMQDCILHREFKS